MRNTLKILAVAAGLTVIATPALAHGPGPFAPVRGVATLIGAAVHAVVPAPAPAPRRAIAPVRAFRVAPPVVRPVLRH